MVENRVNTELNVASVQGAFVKLFLEIGPMEFMKKMEFINIGPMVQQLIGKAIEQRMRTGKADEAEPI